MERVLHVEQIRALRKMSVGERLALNASLWEHALVLKEATLRAQHADWTPDRIKAAAREALQNAGR